MRENNRSKKYQFLYCEILTEEKYFYDIVDDNKLITDELRDLFEARKKRFIKIIDQHCTETQKQTIYLLMSGKTQQETATILGKKNQSNVWKALWGNLVYLKKLDKWEMRGGAIKRLRNAAKDDIILKKIEEKILELYE